MIFKRNEHSRQREGMELQIKELDVDLIAPNLETMNRPEQGGSKIVIIGKPGCFEKGTRIKLFGGGVKPVECMTLRDLVVGWDGKARYLQSLCRGWDQLYKITFGKTRVVVNEEHVLTLFDLENQRVVDLPVWELSGYHLDGFRWITIRKGRWRLYPFTFEAVGFGEYYGFELFGNDHHFLLADGSLVHNTGKCLAKNTRILMHDFSIKLVQHINQGDLLFGDDGLPRRVLSISSGRDKMYSVRQAFGDDYTVNSEHILCLRSMNDVKDKTVLEIPCEEAFLNKDVLLQNYGGYKWKGIYRGDDLPCSDVSFYRQIQRPHLDGVPLRFKEKEVPDVYPLRIEEAEEDGEYFGFEIDGNGRFCLGDGTVTHNTTLITSLLYEKRHIFPVAFIMSGTEDSNGHYKKIVPSTFVYNKLQEKKIEDFVMRQKIAKKHLPNPWAVLLLDDCTDDPKLFNKPLFQGLYKNGRHWKMWFILSLQYCMDIKPVIRTNVDGVFILRETNLRNRKSLWENYAGIVPDFSMFCSIMDQITDNYTALYIHNATTSNSLEDCLFWYKAKPTPPDFRFGAKDLWKFHYNRYDKRYSDPFV